MTLVNTPLERVDWAGVIRLAANLPSRVERDESRLIPLHRRIPRKPKRVAKDPLTTALRSHHYDETGRLIA